MVEKYDISDRGDPTDLLDDRYRHKSTILTQHQPVLPYTYTSTNRYHFIIHYLVTGIFVSFTTQYTWSSCHYNCYPHQGGSTGRLHYRGCHQHHHHRCDVGRAADQSSWRRHYSMSTLRHATLQHCNSTTSGLILRQNFQTIAL